MDSGVEQLLAVFVSLAIYLRNIFLEYQRLMP